MAERLAYAYVRFLLILEIALFGVSLVLHLSVQNGADSLLLRLEVPLIQISVVMGTSMFAFLKDSLRWRDQIKSCPEWMWGASLCVVLYLLVIFFGVRASTSKGVPLSNTPVLATGFPLAFDASAICILYPLVYSGYLSRGEVRRRALHSIVLVALQIALIWAYSAGYFPLRRSPEVQPWN
jgi:hypothetical protein